MNKLKQLEVCGQSPWLDYLKRSLIESGELRTLIERDGLKGVTSNPSIFEKAIGETDEYANALKQFQVQADRHPRSTSTWRSPISAPPLTCCGRSTIRRKRGTATSAWNALPTSPTTPEPQWRRRCGCGRRWSVAI